MDLEAIVQSIDAEITRLERARALLTGHTAPLKRGLPYTTKPAATPFDSDAKAAAAQERSKERKQIVQHRARWTKTKRIAKRP